MSNLMVEALYARIQDGAFNPGEEFPYSQRDAYKVEARRLEQEVFKAEALTAVGLSDHPKADKAWAWAWERGHACGLHEVLGFLQDLSEMLA